jgi:hypothetical protein
MLYITYEWHGFRPELAFDTVSQVSLAVRVKAKSRDSITWTDAKPGTTLEDVNDWMLEHGQHVLDIRKIAGPAGLRHGGTFRATIGSKADAEAMPRPIRREFEPI